jgi:hypothetical protein
MNQERIRELDDRMKVLDALLSQSRNIDGSSPVAQGEKQYWEDRREEHQLLLAERKRLMPN